MKFPVIAASFAAWVFATAVQAAPEPCRDAPNGKVLDFWVGDWTVVDVKDGSKLGDSRIERVLGGCAVTEDWHGTGDDDDQGRSLFTFDARSGLWDQVWVTGDTSRPGGLKTKQMIAARPDGAVRFQGTLYVRSGITLLDRTTLTLQPDGRVRQTIEDSRRRHKLERRFRCVLSEEEHLILPRHHGRA